MWRRKTWCYEPIENHAKNEFLPRKIIKSRAHLVSYSHLKVSTPSSFVGEKEVKGRLKARKARTYNHPCKIIDHRVNTKTGVTEYFVEYEEKFCGLKVTPASEWLPFDDVGFAAISEYHDACGEEPPSQVTPSSLGKPTKSCIREKTNDVTMAIIRKFQKILRG